jgi:hypothetical protein
METNGRDEIAASVAAQQTLGPGYDQALAEGLVERISAEIDNRIAAQIDRRVRAEVDEWVDARLDEHVGCRHVRRSRRRADRARRRADRAGRPSVLLPLGSLVAAVAASLVVLLSSQTSVATNDGFTRSGPGAGAVMLTVVIWVAIAVINVAYARRQQP